MKPGGIDSLESILGSLKFGLSSGNIDKMQHLHLGRGGAGEWGVVHFSKDDMKEWAFFKAINSMITSKICLVFLQTWSVNRV
jgi:hypothetical protein